MAATTTLESLFTVQYAQRMSNNLDVLDKARRMRWNGDWEGAREVLRPICGAAGLDSDEEAPEETAELAIACMYLAEIAVINGQTLETPEAMHEAAETLEQAMAVVDNLASAVDAEAQVGALKRLFSWRKRNQADGLSPETREAFVVLHSLVEAEVRLAGGVLQAMWALVAFRDGSYTRGAYRIRKSWKAIEGAAAALPAAAASPHAKFTVSTGEDEAGTPPEVSRMHRLEVTVGGVVYDMSLLVSVAQLATGAFHYVMSRIPSSLTFLARLVGFTGNAVQGMAELNACAYGQGQEAATGTFLVSLLLLFSSHTEEDKARGLEMLEGLLIEYPQGAIVSVAGGYVFRARGELDRAMALFEHVRTSAPNEQLRLNAARELGRVHLGLGEWAEAERLFRLFLSQSTATTWLPWASYQLAVGLCGMGRWQEAAHMLRSIQDLECPPRRQFANYAERRSREFMERMEVVDQGSVAGTAGLPDVDTVTPVDADEAEGVRGQLHQTGDGGAIRVPEDVWVEDGDAWRVLPMPYAEFAYHAAYLARDCGQFERALELVNACERAYLSRVLVGRPHLPGDWRLADVSAACGYMRTSCLRELGRLEEARGAGERMLEGTHPQIAERWAIPFTHYELCEVAIRAGDPDTAQMHIDAVNATPAGFAWERQVQSKAKRCADVVRGLGAQ